MIETARRKSEASGFTAVHRLLVVEDDAEMRSLLVEALASEGRKVYDVADGEQAIHRLRTEASFDVVVSDIKMPNRDGHAVLQEVVENHPRTKVVLITAFGEVDEYLDAMNRGAFEYLVKPLKMVDLTRVVNRALSEIPGGRMAAKPGRGAQRNA